MPLKKVIADIGRNVFSPLNGKKGSQKSYYPNCNGNTLPNRHIYYEPPEEWDAASFLLPISNTAGEIIVHRLATTPDSKPNGVKSTPDISQNKRSSHFETPTSEAIPNNTKEPTKDKERAYTKEEFTTAILARSQQDADYRKSCPSLSPIVLKDGTQVSQVAEAVKPNMGDSGVASMMRDSVTGPSNGQSVIVGEGREECDCERRCSNPKHTHDCKSGDYAISPVLERRNKGVLGRLRNFALYNSFEISKY